MRMPACNGVATEHAAELDQALTAVIVAVEPCRRYVHAYAN